MYKASWLILIGFLVIAIADFISTFRVGELVQYMEANPLFIMGGWYPVILMNFVAVYLLLRAYSNKGNLLNNWTAITAFFWVSILRIGVIINNYQIGNEVLTGEITKAMVMDTPPEIKINFYLTTLVTIALPLFITMRIGWVFSWDFKIERKEK